jgi:hypothetical protein
MSHIKGRTLIEGVREKYFGSKRDEVTECWKKYTARSFIFCALHKLLLG